MSLIKVPIYPTRNLATEIDPGARSIVAGTNVTFTTNADGSITINSVSGSGTVTSVGATGSTGLTVGGSPITTSGTLTFTLSANLQSWSGIAPSSKADTSNVWTLTGNQTSTGTKTIEDTNAVKMVFSRTGTGANSSVEWKTTGGSIFAGMQGAGVWAIAGTASLTTTPWLEVRQGSVRTQGFGGASDAGVYYLGDAALDNFIYKQSGDNAFIFRIGTVPVQARLDAGGTILTTTGNMSIGSALGFGSAVGSSNSDVTRHIALYGTSYGFGITGNRLNYIAPINARHTFVVNGVDSVSVGAANTSDTLLVPGSLRSTGSGAILHSYDRTSSRQWGWYGTGDVFRLWNGSTDIITVDPSGNQSNDGYIWPTAAGAGSKKLTQILVSSSAPAGLADGTLYLRY